MQDFTFEDTGVLLNVKAICVLLYFDGNKLSFMKQNKKSITWNMLLVPQKSTTLLIAF